MRSRKLAHMLTAPMRRSTLPVLRGPGRGLRVAVGDSIVRITGRGEPDIETKMLELIGPHDVVFDAGANIGWYSLLAARVAREVVAFEPSLDNARLAQRNAAANRLSNLTVVPAALTDEDGWLPFLERGSLMGRLEKSDSDDQAARRAKNSFNGATRTMVPAASLDRWLAATGHAPPSVMKIDVEGAELGVLRGMRHTLDTARPALIIELHGTRGEVVPLLEEAGYSHEALSRSHLLARSVTA